MSVAVYRAAELQPSASALEWLRQLGDCCWIDIPGRRQGAPTVISTLLHGNEPSGTEALWRWLNTNPEPEYQVSLLIGNIEAALTEPLFSHRYLPGQRDFNRCFATPEYDRQGKQATEIAARLLDLKPACLVDLHNTSGEGPAFAVALDASAEVCRLASLFCRRMITTDLRVGSLMEVPLSCPRVTIECGGAQSEEASNTAYDGVQALVKGSGSGVAGTDFPAEFDVFNHPLRVSLLPGHGIDFAMTGPFPGYRGLTLRGDIEHCNFGITAAGTRLGWMTGEPQQLIRASDGSDTNRANELFVVEAGELRCQSAMHLFMATSNSRIALQDCLFYAVPA